MEKDLPVAVEKAKKIKLVILDVHGVLTPTDVLYDSEGNRYRTFSHDDGFGANCLMHGGNIEIAIITRKSKSTEARCKDIGIKRFYAAKDKVAKYQELLAELNLQEDEVCYVGDEIIDLGVMRRVGFAVAPSDGKSQAKAAAHYITQAAGGKGVLRELAEFILQAQGKWDSFVEKIASKGW